MKKKILFILTACLCVIFLSTGSSIAKKKFTRIEARTTTFGGSGYVLGFGATDILNKKSAWVRGSVLESSGSPENIRAVGDDKKKRKRTFFTCSYEWFERAKKERPPFDEDPGKYKDIMVMINEQKLAAFLITLDPNIKTLADLKGKRVATWPRGTAKYHMTHNLIAGAGKDVIDSVKWQYTAYAGYDDMILGKTDAAFAFAPERGLGKFTTVPKLKELMSKRKVYFVTATPAMRKKSGELFGDAYGATMKVSAGSFGKGVPRHDVIGFAIIIAWAVYPEMPENVVYEIVKTLDENHPMMKEYHPAGKSWVPDNFGTYPAPAAFYHPGAKKYYDEKGIKYGRQWFLEAYK
ncbi:MAG: TAXI family TRAP transporter solute-binding subunit [Desulfobacterales bacterium]|nr:TAXI family TRAP transporter solute-binding subunit [Desulfobacterales bacterium]